MEGSQGVTGAREPVEGVREGGKSGEEGRRDGLPPLVGFDRPRFDEQGRHEEDPDRPRPCRKQSSQPRRSPLATPSPPEGEKGRQQEEGFAVRRQEEEAQREGSEEDQRSSRHIG